jgi:hypothetical protein
MMNRRSLEMSGHIVAGFRFLLRQIGVQFIVWSSPFDAALVRREIEAIDDTLEHAAVFHETEVEVLSARLARRYDPAAALNEAANRAIADKRAAPEWAPHPLALEVQKRTIERAIRNAGKGPVTRA